jgi:hypothetical protein
MCEFRHFLPMPENEFTYHPKLKGRKKWKTDDQKPATSRDLQIELTISADTKATDRSERDLINRATLAFSRAATGFKAATTDRVVVANRVFKTVEMTRINDAIPDFKTVETTEIPAATKNFNRELTSFNRGTINFSHEIISFNRAGVLPRKGAAASSHGSEKNRCRASYRICK